MKRSALLIICTVVLALLMPLTIQGHATPAASARVALLHTTTRSQAGAYGKGQGPDLPSNVDPTLQASVVLQQGSNGYAGCEDTFISQGAPNDNFCAQDLLQVGHNQQYAALLRFDLAPIPADAIVAQASLQLYATDWAGSNINLRAHVVLRNVDLCQATWNQARYADNWGQPGCNDTTTDGRSSAESTVATSQVMRWHDLDLTSAVQGWLNGSLPNNGLLLRASYSYSVFRFASADNSSLNLRPKLVITYQRPAGPTPTPVSTVSFASATPTATATVPNPTLSQHNTPTATTTRTPAGGLTGTPTPTPTLTPIYSPGLTMIQASAVLQQGSNGYAGCQDTFISQGAPNDNFCAQDLLQVGYNQQYAALLRFDLAPIPADAIVAQASLQLYATDWAGSNINLRAHVVLRNVDLCQATWNQARYADNWGQPGCNDTTTDRRSSAESTVATSQVMRWHDLDLTSAVQGWLNGSLPNNGLLLRASYSESLIRFASADSSNPGLRPKLVVVYRYPVTPTPTSTPPGFVASPTPTATPVFGTPTATTVVPVASPTPTQGALTIGHITDVHVGGSAGIYYGRAGAALRLIDQQAQVMVDTGDCTEDGTAAQTMDYLHLVTSNLNIPWRVLPGNHDTPSIFTTYIGPLQWYYDIGGYRLIGINTESINYTLLDQALTTEKPCIVFGHFPLSYLDAANQAQLRQRFRAYNVPIYTSGHTHEHSLETDAYSGTLLLTGARAGWGNYRLITLRGFEVESVTTEFAPY